MAVLAGGGRGLRLPLILTDDEDIEAVCALVRGGQAKAVMQLVVGPLGGVPQSGVVVTEITSSGWIALEALTAESEPRSV
jgi:hypothetical protein